MKDGLVRSKWGDFSGGAVVKNLPASAGDTGSILDQEDPTCRGSNKPVHHTTEPAL